MPRLKRRQISDAVVRRALTRLEPPTDTMLLDAETIKVSRKLDALLKRRGYDSRAIQHLLDEFASSSPPVMHTLGGGGFGFPLFDRKPVALFKILEGLYLPTDTDSWRCHPSVGILITKLARAQPAPPAHIRTMAN
jgi:hypothetical protein